MTRRILLLVLLAAVLLAGAAFARDRDDCGGVSLNTSGITRPVRWAPRQDLFDARMVITSRSGDADLILNSRVVAMQLSDHALKRVRRQLRDANENAEANAGNPVGWFESAVLATVGSLIDHSAECPVRLIRDVEYVDGRLEFTGTDGGSVFEHLDVDSRDVLSQFDPDDARRFVAEFHHVKGSTR